MYKSPYPWSSGHLSVYRSSLRGLPSCHASSPSHVPPNTLAPSPAPSSPLCHVSPSTWDHFLMLIFSPSHSHGPPHTIFHCFHLFLEVFLIVLLILLFLLLSTSWSYRAYIILLFCYNSPPALPPAPPPCACPLSSFFKLLYLTLS